MKYLIKKTKNKKTSKQNKTQKKGRGIQICRKDDFITKKSNITDMYIESKKRYLKLKKYLDKFTIDEIINMHETDPEYGGILLSYKKGILSELKKIVLFLYICKNINFIPNYSHIYRMFEGKQIINEDNVLGGPSTKRWLGRSSTINTINDIIKHKKDTSKLPSFVNFWELLTKQHNNCKYIYDEYVFLADLYYYKLDKSDDITKKAKTKMFIDTIITDSESNSPDNAYIYNLSETYGDMDIIRKNIFEYIKNINNKDNLLFIKQLRKVFKEFKKLYQLYKIEDINDNRFQSTYDKELKNAEESYEKIKNRSITDTGSINIDINNPDLQDFVSLERIPKSKRLKRTKRSTMFRNKFNTVLMELE